MSIRVARILIPISFVCALFIARIAAGDSSPQLADDSAPNEQSRLQILEKEVSALQKSLADANARCTELQNQNASLRKRLGELSSPVSTPFPTPPQPTPAAAGATGNAPDVIALPPFAQWGIKATNNKRELLSGISAASITLTGFDDSLLVKPLDSTHLSLLERRISKGLGTDSTLEAGKVWVESGSLFLQWSPGDQSAALSYWR